MWKEIVPLKEYRSGSAVHMCGPGVCNMRERGRYNVICPVSHMIHGVIHDTDVDETEDTDFHQYRKNHVDTKTEENAYPRKLHELFMLMMSERKKVAGLRLFSEEVARNGGVKPKLDEATHAYLKNLVTKYTTFSDSEINNLIEVTLQISKKDIERVFVALCYALAGYRDVPVVTKLKYCLPDPHRLDKSIDVANLEQELKLVKEYLDKYPNSITIGK